MLVVIVSIIRCDKSISIGTPFKAVFSIWFQNDGMIKVSSDELSSFNITRRLGNGDSDGGEGLTRHTSDPDGAKLLTGLTAGTLDLGTVTNWGSPATPVGTTATMAITLNSGTADLFLSSNPALNTKNFQLQNISGATSLTVEMNFNIALAANFPGTARGNDPYLIAMRAIAAETHSVTATYLGLKHTTDGVSFNNGLPAGAEAVDMSSSENDWGTDGASSSWTVDNDNDWQGLNGFDTVDTVDGNDPANNYTVATNGDGVIQDIESVYATGMRYVITRTDGQALNSDTQFLFSTGGAQWPDTVNLPVVPEPSSTLLGCLAGTVLLLKRKR